MAAAAGDAAEAAAAAAAGCKVTQRRRFLEVSAGQCVSVKTTES